MQRYRTTKVNVHYHSLSFTLVVYIHSICNLVQINLGPQHPSTHGVLRITCLLECESIKWIEADIGLLHRGSEKLIEYRSANKSLP